MMSFCALKGLIEAKDSVPTDKTIRIVGLFDNEEVGSLTAHGANSNLLESTIQRLATASFLEKNSVAVPKVNTTLVFAKPYFNLL